MAQDDMPLVIFCSQCPGKAFPTDVDFERGYAVCPDCGHHISLQGGLSDELEPPNFSDD